jgi:TPR repeat protein
MSPEAKEKINELHQSALRWFETYLLNSNPHSVSCSQDALPKAFFSEVLKCFSAKGFAKTVAARYYFADQFGVPRDYARAATLLASSIADGVYAEGETYAHMLDNGLGVARDPAAASKVRRQTEEWRRNWVRR